MRLARAVVVVAACSTIAVGGCASEPPRPAPEPRPEPKPEPKPASPPDRPPAPGPRPAPAPDPEREARIARLEREARSGQAGQAGQPATGQPATGRPATAAVGRGVVDPGEPRQEVVVRANRALQERRWRDYGACFSPQTQRLLGVELIVYLGGRALAAEESRDPSSATLWKLVAAHGVGRDALVPLFRSQGWDQYARQRELVGERIADPLAVFDLIPDASTCGLNVFFLGSGALADVQPKGRGWTALALSSGRPALPVEVRSGRTLTVHIHQAQYLDALRKDFEQAAGSRE